MGFDEEQRTSRVVVDTPHERREVVRSETIREPESQGISTGAVAAIVIAAIALTAIAFMFLMNKGESTADAEQRLSAVPTAVAPKAAPPQTVIVQQPAAAAVPPTTIIQQVPAPTAAAAQAAGSDSAKPVVDDGMLQANITNAFLNDSELATAEVEVAVLNAEATLTGNVNTDELKRRAERLARAINGVKKVDNKVIAINSSMLSQP